MHPKYSIIVPVYNVRPWLPSCLDSVLNQTVGNWECVCVDDGSTDGSSVILDAFQSKDPRFRVFHRSNAGVGAARNFALDIVRGDWIVYLDADDMLADTALETFDALERCVPDADMMNYELGRIAEDVQVVRSPKQVMPLNIRQQRDRPSIVTGFLGIDFWTYAYRRTALGKFRFKGYSVGEDRLYLAQCHAICKSKVRCENVGYYVRTRKGSAIRSKWTLKKFSDLVNSRREIVDVVHRLDVSIPRSEAKMVLQSLMEMSPPDIDRLDSNDRAGAWMVFFAALDSLDRTVAVTIWQRFVLAMLVESHSRVLGQVLCVWPHKLKILKSRFINRIKKWRKTCSR